MNAAPPRAGSARQVALSQRGGRKNSVPVGWPVVVRPGGGVIVADASNTGETESEGLVPCPAAACRTRVKGTGCWAAIASKLRGPGTAPVWLTVAVPGHTLDILTGGRIIMAEVATWPVLFIPVKYWVIRTSRLSFSIVPTGRYTNCVSPSGRPSFARTVKNTAPENAANHDVKKYFLGSRVRSGAGTVRKGRPRGRPEQVPI